MIIYLSMSLTGLQADAATFRCKQQPIVTYRMQPTVAYSSQHAKVAISSQRLNTAANGCTQQPTGACFSRQLHAAGSSCIQHSTAAYSRQKLHTAGKIYLYVARVADPVHFRPDPDPANQNFKTGSGSCLKKTHFSCPAYFLHGL